MAGTGKRRARQVMVFGPLRPVRVGRQRERHRPRFAGPNAAPPLPAALQDASWHLDLPAAGKVA